MAHSLAFLPHAFLLLASAPLAQEPLFAFVHTSDSQPTNAADQNAFEGVLETIADSGRPGALLRERVAFVLFAGDLVDSNNTGEWNTFVDTIDTYLTAGGIPLLAVPGNHDQSNGSVSLYEQFIADSAPWDASSAVLTGQNGPSISTGWEGLRFIGLNNSNGGQNQVANSDRLSVEMLAQSAVAEEENVFLIAHHPHDAGSGIPLLAALETPSVIGFMHGHTGSPRVRRLLTSVDNPDAWEFNTNSIFEDGALIYFEAFPEELHAYVLQLRTSPSSLPARVVIPLVHPLRSAGAGPGGPLRLEPVADASVQSSRSRQNFGGETTLRLRDDQNALWKSYLRFDLSTLQGAPLDSARLRLFCTDSSSDGGALYAVSSAWSESAITYSNAPTISGTPLITTRSVTLGTWREIDVTAAINAGTTSFALLSASSNGAAYSSREGGDAPELVLELAPPPAITRLVPAAVAVFAPGTQEILRVEGSGFGAGTSVEFDGVALPSSAFTVLDAATLTLDPPTAAIGTHTLTVRRGARTATTALQVVLPSTPILQVGTGDALNPIATGQPVRILVSGPIGSRQVVLMSLSPGPSSSSLVELQLGNGFSDIATVATLTIPPGGYAEHQFPALVTLPLTVYAQSVSVPLRGRAPYPASNLQTVRMLP